MGDGRGCGHAELLSGARRGAGFPASLWCGAVCLALAVWGGSRRAVLRTTVLAVLVRGMNGCGAPARPVLMAIWAPLSRAFFQRPTDRFYYTTSQQFGACSRVAGYFEAISKISNDMQNK